MTKQEVIALVVAASHHATHRHCGTCTCDVPPDRDLIHTRVSGLGADWDLDVAIALIEEADLIEWLPDLFSHNLVVKAGDRVVRFDVKKPE